MEPKPLPFIKTELDIRSVPPPQRHPLIDATFDNLQPGEAFVLVNDHDPKPLHYAFHYERPGQFTWEYLEQGPDIWRVRIGKTERVIHNATPVREVHDDREEH